MLVILAVIFFYLAVMSGSPMVNQGHKPTFFTFPAFCMASCCLGKAEATGAFIHTAIHTLVSMAGGEAAESSYNMFWRERN